MSRLADISDRSSPEYLECIFALHEEAHPDGLLWGIPANEAPETFEELTTLVEKSKGHGPGERDSEVTEFMSSIEGSCDRDAVVRAMPFIPEGFLILVDLC